MARSWQRLRALSPALLDWGLALLMTMLMLLSASPLANQPGGYAATFLVTLPLGLRRRYPVPVFLVTMAGAILGGGHVNGAGPGYVAIACIMIAAYSVGAYSSRRLPSLGLLLAAGLVVVAIHGELPAIPAEIGPFLVLVPLWLIGSAIRSRQLRADLFEDRAARLEREHDAAMEAAAAAERERLAREMHDVIAHGVSVMVVQAGAARQVLGSSPEQAREALLSVEETGRAAMGELRKMLGILGDGEPAAALAPQPGLEQLGPLVRRTEEAGLPIQLHIRGDRRPLPQAVDLAAYRIVQEALTNCLRYSGLARTEVRLDYRDRELKLEILDEGGHDPSPGAAGGGRGLAGMRQRVELYGGTLEAGPRLERGYAVRAWLPLAPATS